MGPHIGLDMRKAIARHCRAAPHDLIQLGEVGNAFEHLLVGYVLEDQTNTIVMTHFDSVVRHDDEPVGRKFRAVQELEHARGITRLGIAEVRIQGEQVFDNDEADVIIHKRHELMTANNKRQLCVRPKAALAGHPERDTSRSHPETRLAHNDVARRSVALDLSGERAQQVGIKISGDKYRQADRFLQGPAYCLLFMMFCGENRAAVTIW